MTTEQPKIQPFHIFIFILAFLTASIHFSQPDPVFEVKRVRVLGHRNRGFVSH